jgi:hypothetical protein
VRELNDPNVRLVEDENTSIVVFSGAEPPSRNGG